MKEGLEPKGKVHRDLLGTQVPVPSARAPPMGMQPGVEATSRGLFPLPRFCETEPPACRGHAGARRRRHLGRVRESNRALARLETIHGGRLSEVIDASGAPAPSPCGRSAREGAATQVWEAVCRHDPPLREEEGVDALQDIAEDVEVYAVHERCDIVDRAECFAEWMSLPS